MIRLHVVANALLLWLGYYWLGVGESTIPRLFWSALVAVALICAALIVHGSALTAEKPMRPAVSRAARNLAPLFLLALVTLILYGLLAWWRGASEKPAFTLASWLTLHLRKPVKPETMLALFNGLLCIVRWMLIPCVVLPLAAALARDGWTGGRHSGWKRSWKYWIAIPLLLVCALWLPLKLIGWVPHMNGFGMEMASFLIRLVIGYGLYVAGLLGAAWVTARFGGDAGRSPELLQ